MFRTDDAETPVFSELIELDLDTIEPSVAGPKRPQDRVSLPSVWESFTSAFAVDKKPDNDDIPRPNFEGGTADVAGVRAPATAVMPRPPKRVPNGSVGTSAITSSTNT